MRRYPSPITIRNAFGAHSHGVASTFAKTVGLCNTILLKNFPVLPGPRVMCKSCGEPLCNTDRPVFDGRGIYEFRNAKFPGFRFSRQRRSIYRGFTIISQLPCDSSWITRIYVLRINLSRARCNAVAGVQENDKWYFARFGYIGTHRVFNGI